MTKIHFILSAFFVNPQCPLWFIKIKIKAHSKQSSRKDRRVTFEASSLYFWIYLRKIFLCYLGYQLRLVKRSGKNCC